MYGLLLTLHILICVCLVFVVLLQSGKGGGLAGGAFGGTAQTVFGGRGATDFMTRATMVLGAAFFATSLTLALMTSTTRGPSRSLLQEQARRSTTASPRPAPGSTAPAPSAPAPAGGTQGQPAPSGAAPPAGTQPQSPPPGGNR